MLKDCVYKIIQEFHLSFIYIDISDTNILVSSSGRDFGKCTNARTKTIKIYFADQPWCKMEIAANEVRGGQEVTSIIEDSSLGVTIYLSENMGRHAFKRLIVPFYLHIQDFPLVHGFLLKNPLSIPAANIMLTSPISSGTQKSYTPVKKTFQILGFRAYIL